MQNTKTSSTVSTTKTSASTSTVKNVQTNNLLANFANMQQVASTRTKNSYNISSNLQTILSKYTNLTQQQVQVIKALKKVSNASNVIFTNTNTIVVTLHKLNISANFVQQNISNNNVYIITTSANNKKHAWLVCTLQLDELLQVSANSSTINIATLQQVQIFNTAQNNINANVKLALASIKQ